MRNHWQSAALPEAHRRERLQPTGVRWTWKAFLTPTIPSQLKWATIPSRFNLSHWLIVRWIGVISSVFLTHTTSPRLRSIGTYEVVRDRILASLCSTMASSSQSNSLILHRATEGTVTLARSYRQGRVVDELFLSAGEAIGKKINKVAIKGGWGPTETIKRIRKILGEGDARKLALNKLYAFCAKEVLDRRHEFFELQRACFDLMRYTLP